MRQPRNYQELQAAAKREIANKIIELEERIEALQRLHDQFETITDWSGSSGLCADAAMYGDTDDLEHLNSLTTFWPDVKSAPGEGYW